MVEQLVVWKKLREGMNRDKKQRQESDSGFI
jgi:hypothetical protein